MSVSAAPIPKISALFATQSKPILSPYFVNFMDKDQTSLSEAFENPGLKTATIAFATAHKNRVCSLLFLTLTYRF
jgi:hypothetical protein